MSGVLKISIAALVWLSHLVLQAQEPLQVDSLSHSINYLDAVVVNQVQQYRTTIPALVIEASDIEKLSPLNVADVLHQCAGVQVKDYGGIGGIKTINIRSMGSQHTGIFYDGFQLGNAQNGQIDLGQLSMENISSISVHQGQRSSIFQSACEFGQASSVYLTTSPYLGQCFTNSERKVATRLKLQGGSFDFQRLSLTQSFRLSPVLRLSYHVEELTSSGKYEFRYRRRNYDGTIAYDTTATRQNGDVQALSGEINLYYEGSTDHAQVKGYTYHSNRGIPGAIVNNVWRGGERQSDHNTFIQGKYARNFSDTRSGFIKAKYAHYDTHYINNDSTRYLSDNLFRQNEAYLSLCHAWHDIGSWCFSTSYDFSYHNLHANLPLFETPQRFSHQLSAAGGFGSKHLNAQVSLLGTDICDHHSGNVSHFRHLTPAFYLRWKLNGENGSTDYGGFSLHAFAKQSFRMPTFNDLYYTDMGNSYLKPEKAWQFDAGIQYATRIRDHHFSMFADVYHNRVTNKIVAYPKGQQFRWTMLNLGKVEINGLDANVGYRYPHGVFSSQGAVSLDFQYTLQQAIDVTDKNDPYYRDQIPYMPHHSGSFTVGFEQGRWMANYHFTYVGERWSQQENIRYNHLEPWYTSDVNIQYRHSTSRACYKIVAEVLNLLDQQYDVIANYPMPGRNYRLSLCAEF